MAAPFYYPWDPYGTNEKVSINILRAPIIFKIFQNCHKSFIPQKNAATMAQSFFNNISMYLAVPW